MLQSTCPNLQDHIPKSQWHLCHVSQQQTVYLGCHLLSLVLIMLRFHSCWVFPVGSASNNPSDFFNCCHKTYRFFRTPHDMFDSGCQGNVKSAQFEATLYLTRLIKSHKMSKKKFMVFWVQQSISIVFWELIVDLESFSPATHPIFTINHYFCLMSH